MEFDNLIVGAGFSGVVLAERLATQRGQSCLVVEKRSHIGGNSYDEYDSSGVLIHKYGPHYFRTNSQKVRQYLSQFTEWRPVDYKILSWTRDRYWSFPINLGTFEQLIGRASTEEEFKAYLEDKRVPIAHPKNSEEAVVSQVGWELYEMFFKNYTIKQWDRHPRDLDASVCGRIPVRTNRDDRYLAENFQALPQEGYTRMFERMLRASDRVKLLLKTDYREVLSQVRFGRLIYTGPIDDFFDRRFGPLPYRSLRFERQSFDADQLREREAVAGKKGFWQPAMQVNYPNDHSYTRIVEMKHATGQECAATTIVREYPAAYGAGNEPYYPIPAPDTERIYAQYAALAAERPAVVFLGRLANYRYYNMDQAVGLALKRFEELELKA